MNGGSFVALSCICFMALANQTAASHYYHRYNDLGVNDTSDQPLKADRELPPVQSTEKEPDVIKKTFPPRLATNAELVQYKQLLETTIKKSILSADGESMNAIQVDDLLTAKIKHAVLPDPFTTVVQAFTIKFRGHFPNDSKKKLICRVTFECVQIHGEPDKIVSPPTNFICNMRKEGDAATATRPIVEAATVNPNTTPKDLKKNENVNESNQTETRPKDEMKTEQHPKDVKNVENHSKNDDVSSKKPVIVKDKMKIVHHKTYHKYRY